MYKCQESVILHIVYFSKVLSVLKTLHNVDVGGIEGCHPTGRDKLIELFNAEHYFLGIRKQVETFLQSCPTCKSTVALSHVKAPPIPIRTFFPYQRLQFDLIQMASKTKKHMALNHWRFAYISTIKCCFSKFAWLFPLRKKEIEGVYKALKFLFEKEGFPEIFQSDNGKEFVGGIIKKFLKSHEVQIKHGRPRHPQSQGQVENLNKTIKHHLRRILCNLPEEKQGKVWPMLLPGVATMYNNSYHHTIQDVPFRLYRNRDPSQLKHHIVPDDVTWCYQSGVDVNGPDVDEELDEDDDDELEDELDDAELPIIRNPQQPFSINDLLQSCSSASLNTQFLTQENPSSTPEEFSCSIDDSLEGDLDEFDVVQLPSSLYSIAKVSEWNQYHALESTEYTIHKNFKRALGKNQIHRLKWGKKFYFAIQT